MAVITEATAMAPEQIMARVRSVLDPDNAGKITFAQRELFENTVSQIALFGAESTNPMVSIVDHVGNYWCNWLFMILRTGSYRPSMIIKILAALDPSRPISYRMLTLNLRALERDGLIEREMVSSEVNHVEYHLSALGRDLADQIAAMIRWIGDHGSEVVEARARFDAARS